MPSLWGRKVCFLNLVVLWGFYSYRIDY